MSKAPLVTNRPLPGGAILLVSAMLVVQAFAAESEPAPLASRAPIEAAVRRPQRSPNFVRRDAVRHPAEELAFFGLKPDMSVVEIWPGGGYWTEVLAPLLHDKGAYEVAVPPLRDPSTPVSASAIGRKLAADPAIYGKVVQGVVGSGHFDIAPPNSVDLIVTFRNVHNWMADGYAPDMFAAFFKALKHGGILGLEEHRGNRIKAQDPRAADGYVNQDTLVALASAAGFVPQGSSEMNANRKDTANWPKGVWTLPPDLALGATDREKYEAVGEADNAVLKFVKP